MRRRRWEDSEMYGSVLLELVLRPVLGDGLLMGMLVVVKVLGGDLKQFRGEEFRRLPERPRRSSRSSIGLAWSGWGSLLKRVGDLFP